jgi:mannose-1-phosphate guanylyltransferase
MAGGVGSRFWPLSKEDKPKQFLDILGTGRSLLQMTFDRFIKICPVENIYLVTNAAYKEDILRQLPDISEQQVLLEPARRNTAPCIAYANYRILNKNPQARIITAPSDHLIVKEDVFLKVAQKGLDFVDGKDALLTLGIQPGRPETGYGYIQVANEKPEKRYPNIDRVKTFTEKPNKELAKVFFESGEFYWNSGIFIWSLKTIMKAFQDYLPEVDALFEKGVGIYDTSKEEAFIEDTYYNCKNISIDYGIMEKADNVFVYCTDFGWADLGTWGSLHEHIPLDDRGNSLRGEKILAYDLDNCIVQMPKNKLAVIQGLKDYIVVDADDILMIVKKEDEQEIKQFVNDVKYKFGEEYL